MAEQRLIDAYKLMQAMYDRAFETDGDTMWQSGCWVRYRAVEQVIRAQPTIEERKTGRWMFSPDHAEGICTICQYKIYGKPYQGNYLIVPYNFCPNCGAKMEGEQHG